MSDQVQPENNIDTLSLTKCKAVQSETNQKTFKKSIANRYLWKALTERVEEIGDFFYAAGDHLNVLAVRPVLLDLFLDAFLGTSHGCFRARAY